MIRVLICDDHAVVRAGLRALLASADDIEVVGEAAGGEEAVVTAGSVRPDVVLMDLQLGGGIDGVEATRRIRTANPTPDTPRILVLATYDRTRTSRARSKPAPSHGEDPPRADLRQARGGHARWSRCRGQGTAPVGVVGSGQPRSGNSQHW